MCTTRETEVYVLDCPRLEDLHLDRMIVQVVSICTAPLSIGDDKNGGERQSLRHFAGLSSLLILKPQKEIPSLRF